MHALTERREPLPCDGESVGVAVETDEYKFRESPQQCLGVTSHAERGIHQHRSGVRDRRREKLDGALEHDGGVDLVVDHSDR